MSAPRKPTVPTRRPISDPAQGASAGVPAGRGRYAPPESGGHGEVGPRVWVLSGYRAGERSQMIALAEALGWPFELRALRYRRGQLRSLLRASDLRGIDRAASSPLVGPWPDLVITAGMRSEPVARWIRQQSEGRTRIVFIGRPWGRLEGFDLVVTTPQYRLPRRPNVLHNTMTLQRVTEARLREAGEVWAPRLAHLPRPYIAVIIGGNSGPYTFGPKASVRLACQVNGMAQAQGGSLLVTSSARTPAAGIRALSEALQVPAHVHEWRAGDPENPYFGYLSLADAFIVTADSVAMLSEACATGRPVYMFDPSGLDRDGRWRVVTPATEVDFRLSASIYRWAMRWGPRRVTRDLARVHRRLKARGHAVWLGESFPDGPIPLPGDMRRAVQRVRELLGGVRIDP